MNDQMPTHGHGISGVLTIDTILLRVSFEPDLFLHFTKRFDATTIHVGLDCLSTPEVDKGAFFTICADVINNFMVPCIILAAIDFMDVVKAVHRKVSNVFNEDFASPADILRERMIPGPKNR